MPTLGRGCDREKARFGPAPRLGDTGQMGMDPFRRHRNSTADYVMVGAAVVVCLGLLLWAFLG